MTNPVSANDDGQGHVAPVDQIDRPDGGPRNLKLSADEIGARRINPGALLSVVLLLLAAQNLLLWRFLDLAPLWLYGVAAIIFGAIAYLMTRAAKAAKWQGPSLRVLLVAGIASLLLFLLGGEGRLFYANADWQIRDAVLHDLITYQWPFAYQTSGPLELLRAPIGMYLIPALIGRGLGAAAADAALLIQNSVLLTLFFALGSTLFAGSRAKAIGLTVFVFFSGMDIVGQLLRSNATGEPIPDHLERWAGSQYSSHITQAFWVPQHALAGWFGALLFLLWRERRISLGQMYALVPLLMLLSPLGVMGVLPFAAYAGIATLLGRRLRLRDFLLPAITTVLTVPGILYLGAAGTSVGLHMMHLKPGPYVLFELLEVIPYVIGVAFLSRCRGHELGTMLLVAACLLVIPFFQLGEGMDFTMRVSITPLAILAAQVAWAFSQGPSGGTGNRPARILLVGTLLIGSVTGALEINRALAYQPTPRVQCNLTSAMYQVVDLPRFSSAATYFAPIDALPALVRPPSVSIVNDANLGPCWDRPWQVPRSHGL